MKKKKRLTATERIARTCAWCGRLIPEGKPISVCGAKTKPGVDLSPYEGDVFPLPLERSNRTLQAIATGHDSPAKKEGYDLMFVVCSENCNHALLDAIQHELDP